MDFVVDCIVDSDEQDLYTQVLQMQKNRLIDTQEHFERYCNMSPVSGFNSTKYDLNLITSFFYPFFSTNQT